MTEEQNGAEAPIETNQEEAAPEAQPPEDPNKVAEAIAKALESQGPPRASLKGCPCGELQEPKINIDVSQDKVGRATCGGCGVWGVDFLVPRTQDQNLIGAAAAKAWNDAPR